MSLLILPLIFFDSEVFSLIQLLSILILHPYFHNMLQMHALIILFVIFFRNFFFNIQFPKSNCLALYRCRCSLYRNVQFNIYKLIFLHFIFITQQQNQSLLLINYVSYHITRAMWQPLCSFFLSCYMCHSFATQVAFLSFVSFISISFSIYHIQYHYLIMPHAKEANTCQRYVLRIQSHILNKQRFEVSHNVKRLTHLTA